MTRPQDCWSQMPNNLISVALYNNKTNKTRTYYTGKKANNKLKTNQTEINLLKRNATKFMLWRLKWKWNFLIMMIWCAHNLCEQDSNNFICVNLFFFWWCCFCCLLFFFIFFFFGLLFVDLVCSWLHLFIHSRLPFCLACFFQHSFRYHRLILSQ